MGDVFSNIFCRHQKILKASVLRASPQVDGDLNFVLARVPFDLYYWRHFLKNHSFRTLLATMGIANIKLRCSSSMNV